MKVFVTGVTGFIGRAFCRVAAAQGHDLLGLCRSSTASGLASCRAAIGSLEAVPWKEIEHFRPDAALHLAWIATPGVYLTSPDNDVLVEQSQILLQGLIQRGVKHVAGVGTCIEYAPSLEPLNEERSPLGPLFPYSRAKVRLFEWMKTEAPKAGVGWTWFRIFYPYGPGERGSRLPSDLIRRLRQNQIVTLRTPHSTKDYLYIDDVAEGLCRALEANVVGALNLGSGRGVAVHDVATTVARLLGSDAALIRTADVPEIDVTPFVVADSSKIRSIGWTPSLGLDEGLGRLISALS